ncbi:MAG: dihydrofolate reductase [Candidatus Campbellbacteria bacterium]|nr:dihydrofolate reductase [Candidatus Campbellbacteria bacterium]
MTLNIIAAFTKKDRVLGKDGRMPWNIPSDLKRFKRLTTGHPVIMGRRTYESIGRSLPNRTNIVVSGEMYGNGRNFTVARTPSEAISKARENEGSDEVFIIGGQEVYRATLHKADRLYLTIIEEEFEGDVFFPNFNEKEFRLVEKEEGSENGYNFTFLTLERK